MKIRQDRAEANATHILKFIRRIGHKQVEITMTSARSESSGHTIAETDEHDFAIGPSFGKYRTRRR